MTTDKISRRTLGGLAAAGVGVPLLAACGSDDPDSGRPTRSASPSVQLVQPGRLDRQRRPERDRDVRAAPPAAATRSPDLGHRGRRRRDLRRRGGRGHPADRGRVQVLHRDLQPPGLHRVERLRRHHQLRLPRQQVLHRERRRRGGPGDVPARRGADHRLGRRDQPGLPGTSRRATSACTHSSRQRRSRGECRRSSRSSSSWRASSSRSARTRAAIRVSSRISRWASEPPSRGWVRPARPGRPRPRSAVRRPAGPRPGPGERRPHAGSGGRARRPTRPAGRGRAGRPAPAA